MTDEDRAVIESVEAIAEYLEHNPLGVRQKQAADLTRLIALVTDSERACELAVGRYIYRRVEVLMDSKAETPANAELAYLAALVTDVEEYGATGEHGVEPPAPALTTLPTEWRDISEALAAYDEYASRCPLKGPGAYRPTDKCPSCGALAKDNCGKEATASYHFLKRVRELVSPPAPTGRAEGWVNPDDHEENP